MFFSNHYHIGKYYLADAGYGIRQGILSPYRGVRYHLNEFRGHIPENEKELYNLRHSSLRTSIERGFGILKKRFHVLDVEPFWSFQTQVDVVLACCIIHNFVMEVDPNDLIMQAMLHENPSDISKNDNPMSQLTQREERDQSQEWSRKRDQIARRMWNDFRNRRVLI